MPKFDNKGAFGAGGGGGGGAGMPGNGTEGNVDVTSFVLISKFEMIVEATTECPSLVSSGILPLRTRC